MHNTEIFSDERSAHHWLQIAGADLLPAVRDCTAPRTPRLIGLDWTGDVPTTWGGAGVVRSVNGWPAYCASATEVRTWWAEGSNLLLHTRWLRGLAVPATALTALQRRLVGVEWQPPVVIAPDGAAVAFMEVSTGYLPTLSHNGVRLLGSGGLAVVAGLDRQGRPYQTVADPLAWGAPRLSRAFFSDLWHALSGQRLPRVSCPPVSTDPRVQWMERNGWLLGANGRGFDVRCPFHPTAFTPAHYHRGRVHCPHCRTGADHIAAMEAF